MGELFSLTLLILYPTLSKPSSSRTRGSIYKWIGLLNHEMDPRVREDDWWGGRVTIKMVMLNSFQHLDR